MATLIRTQIPSNQQSNSQLSTNIPTPFPRDQLFRDHHNQLEAPPVDNQDVQPGQSRTEVSLQEREPSSIGGLHELMPSIAYVQKSCLMTLNDLLSGSTRWNPIVPDRRHSMPSTPQSPTATQADAEQSSTALQTLVSNLRNRETGPVMVESHVCNNDAELIQELRARIQGLSSSLEPSDALLARSLVSLLSHFNRLSTIHNTSSVSRGTRLVNTNSWSPQDATAPADPFDTLKRQLSDLQLERQSSQEGTWSPGTPPVLAVESSLLWSRIDEELEIVVSMCKERTEGLPRFSMADHLPPQYDPADYHFDTPPEYDQGARSSIDDPKARHVHHSPTTATSSSGLNEKMRLDLEAVTMAIDRLYLVAPQLHNQRVELKSSKVEQMEKARQAGGQTSSRWNKQKEKEHDIRDLDRMLDLLGRASDRELKDQSVVLEGGMGTRLEKARIRDMARRTAFVEQLAQHSDAGRFHGQDAVLHPRTKDPEALLTLPEFIRESMPDSLRVEDPEALLTLPEFVKEPPPDRSIHSSSPPPAVPATFSRLRSKKKSRHRSLSAPSMSWLRSTSRGHNTESKTSRPSSSKGSETKPSIGFDVNYIAENHENLQHVLVFLTVTGATPGVDIEAEVLPSFPDSSEGDRLIIKSGPHTSLPLSLPGRTVPGKQEVRVQSGHYEIKLVTLPITLSTAPVDPVPLLDASQLSIANPTSFICASCSLPLVQSSKIGKYRDLPSEHWEELVDAWMCHSDQTLHEQVARHGRGFWPEPGQALVGGSYVLFEESSVTKNNLCPADQTKKGEDWRLVRCLCGAVIGRCQEHHSGNDVNATVYRLLKYAIRPVSPTAEPSRVPLSAFIVEDMTEFVQAHATYRFIILDEEDERPRILIWLFKPSIRLAYSTPTSYAIPKSASIHAAKVLFKILGPSTASTDLGAILNKYPGFPQAEYLFYPMNICRRLAGLLKESNVSYPESMRTMTGLDVGWLHRA